MAEDEGRQRRREDNGAAAVRSTAESPPAAKSWTELLLNDYQMQIRHVSPRCRSHLLNEGGVAGKSYAWKLGARFFVDLLFSFFVSGFCVVAFWRSAWEEAILVAEVAFPDDCLAQNVFSLLAGLVPTFALNLFQPEIRKYLCGDDDRHLRFKVVTYAFTVVLAYFDIWYWKGLWDGIDCIFKYSVTVSLCTLTTGVGILTLLKTFRSSIGCPIGTLVDIREFNCFSSTWHDTTDRDPWISRLSDVSYTLFIEWFVITSWHGLWTLEDNLVEEHRGWNLAEQAWFSLSTGFLAALLNFVIGFIVLRVCDKYKGQHYWPKLGLMFFYNLFGYYATINGFIAFWYLLDYYLPGDDVISGLVHPQVYSVFILIALLNLNALSPGGAARDDPDVAAESGGILAHNYFTTHFFIQKMDWKVNRRRYDQYGYDGVSTVEDLAAPNRRENHGNGTKKPAEELERRRAEEGGGGANHVVVAI